MARKESDFFFSMHACTDPEEIDLKSINEVERMLASHTWRVKKISNDNEARIKIDYVCTKCDGKRAAFVEWIPKKPVLE